MKKSSSVGRVFSDRATLAGPNGPALRDFSQGRFAEIPVPIALGPVRQRGMTAVAVPDRTWRRFGDWNGIRVEALLSHAFLKNYTWTIDFDRRVYLLHDASVQAEP